MKIANIIRKVVLATALLVFITSVASAQQDSVQHTPETRAKALTDRMKTALTLTDDQYGKVYDINLKYAKKNQEVLRSDATKMKKAKAARASNSAKSDELKAVLSQDQFEKFKELQQEQKAGARQALKKRRAGADQ